MKSNIIALVFLFVGGGFVGTLLMSLMKLLSHKRDPSKSPSSQMLKLFAWPIFLALFLIIFSIFILPNLS